MAMASNTMDMTYDGTSMSDKDQVAVTMSPAVVAPAMPSTHVSSLNDMALLDFIARDPRPTLILNLDGPHISIAYRNDALDSHLRIERIDNDTFNSWVTTTPFNDSSRVRQFGGRSWSCVPLQQQWTVVSACCQEHTLSPYPTISSPISQAASSLGRALAQSSKHLSPQSGRAYRSISVSDGVDASETRRGSVISSSWKSVSDDVDRIRRAPRPIDWTRHYVPALSPHIQLVQNFDWGSTPVGSIQSWSDPLRQLVLAMMSNSDPRVLLWGEERRMIYNEACSLLLGLKHPMSMGAKAEDVWSESWDGLLHIVRRAEREGRSTKISSMPLTMERHGYPEETHWSLQMIPIIGPDGQVLGVLDEFSEITNQVIGERRRAAVVNINKIVSHVNNMKELCFEFLEELEACSEDVPFALIYTSPFESDAEFQHTTANGASPHSYTLGGSFGVSVHKKGIPASFDLAECNSNQKTLAGACTRAWESAEGIVLQAKDDTLPEELAAATFDHKQRTVCVLPVPDIAGSGRIVAFLVVGITARRPYDEEAASLVHFLRDIFIKSASAIMLPEEQRKQRQKFEALETSLSQQLTATTLEAQKIEARFARMSQTCPVGMYAISTNSQTLFWNDAYLTVTGITKEEAQDARGKPKEAVHPDDRDRIYEAFLTCIEDKQPFTAEYRLVKPRIYLDPATGKEVCGETWVLANASPELDEEGNVTHVQGWLVDISDRKDHERLRLRRAQIEQSEARFIRLAETAPLGMYLLDVSGRPIYLNDAYFDLLGFTRSDFEEAESRGLGWADRIEDEDRQRVSDAWTALSQDGTPLDLEYRIKKPWKAYDTATGTEMSGPTWLQGTAVAEMDEDGKPIAIQGFVTEISAKKFSERLLSERLEDALETKQQADRFIDMTSHEMRNPLSAILQSADGILTSMESSGLPILNEGMTLTDEVVETIIESAQTIILCAQHQKRIVDDILTLSKLDSNLLVICPDKISVPALLGKVFKMYESELERGAVGADLVIQPSYSELNIDEVMLDSSRLLQIVINLFTNAIKFTQYSEHRQIQVILGASKIRPTSFGSHGYIAPRGNRIDHTISPEWGSGEEIYMHVAVKDSGRGLTEEELKLLFQRFQQASPKTYKQYGGSGLGLFISRELSELQGGQIGVTSEAGKGSTFFFYVKTRRYVPDAPAPPEIEGGRPTPPLLVSPVTYGRAGSVVSHDGSQPEVVITTASTPQMKTATNLRRASLTTKMHTERLHILVVEDNLVNQRVMAQQLKRLGCVVHVANHGIEALDFLRHTHFWNQSSHGIQAASTEPWPPSAIPGEPTPLIPLSVILMDLEMPVLGGLGCVKQIRDLQRAGHLTSHVPVIAVTANARSEQIAVAIDHGMDSVVTKPFRIPELLPQMRSLVARVNAEPME